MFACRNRLPARLKSLSSIPKASAQCCILYTCISYGILAATLAAGLGWITTNSITPASLHVLFVRGFSGLECFIDLLSNPYKNDPSAPLAYCFQTEHKPFCIYFTLCILALSLSVICGRTRTYEQSNSAFQPCT